MEPLFKSEPQKLNAMVHRTLNSDSSLVGVFELDRANSPNTQIEFNSPNSERQKFSRVCSPCSGVLKIFGVFCSNCSIDLSVRKDSFEHSEQRTVTVRSSADRAIQVFSRKKGVHILTSMALEKVGGISAIGP